jgi:hypothetical protein
MITIKITAYSAKYIQKLLKVRQRLDEFMEHLGEGFVKRMVINRSKVRIQLHLLIFRRNIQETVRNSFMNLSKVLCPRLN